MAEVTAKEISGLDNLELPLPPAPGRVSKGWAGTWPKLAALALFLGIWEAGARIKGKAYILPGPGRVIPRFVEDVGNGRLLDATRTTLGRAAFGFALGPRPRPARGARRGP